MTRRLGGNGRNGLSVLATLTLATALACGGGVMAGCGSSSPGNNNNGDSGTTQPVDSGVDTGHDTGTIDTGTADTYVAPMDVETPCQSPTFTPPDGTSFVGLGTGSVTINAPTGFPSTGQIFYTTDQTIPTHASKAYVGAIQITETPETITAIAFASGTCSDSNPVHATYVSTMPTCDAGVGCPVADPVIAPTSSKANNDFLASITDSDSNATICYRLDGSLPTCNANGTCGTGSSTYNGGSLISINGSLPAPATPPTGAVTLTAIACNSTGVASDCGGGPNGIGCEADYVLVVADPFMTNPPSSSDLASGGTYNAIWGSADIPSGNGGISPSLATTTVTTNETVSIWYSAVAAGTTAPTPSCITGTPGTNPTIFKTGVTGEPNTISTSTEVVAMGCKQGYHNSNPTNFTYTLQQAAPVLPAATATFNSVPLVVSPACQADTTAGTGCAALAAKSEEIIVNDTANGGSGDVLCYTLGPSGTAAATCGATGGCGTGSSTLPGDTTGTNSQLRVGNNKSTSTVLSLIACSPSGGRLTAPAVAATYTLQYAAPFVASTDPVGSGGPGWGFAKGGSGTPTTAFNIPTKAGVPYPTTDGAYAWDIALVQPAGCLGSEFEPTAGVPAGCVENQAVDYYCWTTKAGATAACSATGCATGSTPYPAAGTLADADSFANGQALASGSATADVEAANDAMMGPTTLSVIGCQVATPTSGTGGNSNAPAATSGAAPQPAVLFATSAATTIGPVTHSNEATPPTISPASGTNLTGQEVVTISNSDTTATAGSLLCFTTDGTTPVCSVAGNVASCSGTGTTWCIQNGNKNATNVFPASTGITTTSCNSGNPDALIAPNSSGQIPQVPQTGTTAFAEPANVSAFVQANTTAGGSIQAIACNVAEGTSPVAPTATYTFALATPDFSSAPQTTLAVCKGQASGCAASANWDTTPAKTIGVGTPVYITDSSNFDFEPAVSAPAITVHWAWGATPDCGTVANTCPAGTIGGTTGPNCGSASPTGGFGTNINGGQVYSFWSASTNVPAPTMGTSVTLNAIACGQTTNLQADSAVQSVTFNIGAAVPIAVTNQACNALGSASGACSPTTTVTPTTAGCSVTNFGIAGAESTALGAQNALASGNGGCPLANVANGITNWDNAFQIAFAGLTPGSSATPSWLCVSTGSQVSCNGTNGCGPNNINPAATSKDTTGNGNVFLVNVNGGTFKSGTTFYASACAGALPEVDMTPITVQLNTSTVDFVAPTPNLTSTTVLAANSTLTCGETILGASQNSVQVVQDVAAATYLAGGPTSNECFCFTQDGSAVNTSLCAAAGSCGAATTGSTTCESVAATTASAQLQVDGPNTINWATCSFGSTFNNTTAQGSQPYKVTPYAHTIVVDGDVKDWYLNNQNGSGGNLSQAAQPEAFATADLPGQTPHSGLGLVSYDATNLYLGFDNVVYTNVGCTGTTWCYNPSAAISYTGNQQAVGIVIGNGATSQATAPANLNIPNNIFGAVTLNQAEGAQYFVLWQTSAATATVYQWTAGSPGSWALVSGLTPTVKTGTSTAGPGGEPQAAADFELAIPWTSLPAVTAANPSTELTVQGIYEIGFGTGTIAPQFTWAAGVPGGFDGWVNDFTNSCVSPSQTDSQASSANNSNGHAINLNPGE